MYRKSYYKCKCGKEFMSDGRNNKSAREQYEKHIENVIERQGKHGVKMGKTSFKFYR